MLHSTIFINHGLFVSLYSVFFIALLTILRWRCSGRWYSSTEELLVGLVSKIRWNVWRAAYSGASWRKDTAALTSIEALLSSQRSFALNVSATKWSRSTFRYKNFIWQKYILARLGSSCSIAYTVLLIDMLEPLLFVLGHEIPSIFITPPALMAGFEMLAIPSASCPRCC